MKVIIKIDPHHAEDLLKLANNLLEAKDKYGDVEVSYESAEKLVSAMNTLGIVLDNIPLDDGLVTNKEVEN